MAGADLLLHLRQNDYGALGVKVDADLGSNVDLSAAEILADRRHQAYLVLIVPAVFVYLFELYRRRVFLFLPPFLRAHLATTISIELVLSVSDGTGLGSDWIFNRRLDFSGLRSLFLPGVSNHNDAQLALFSLAGAGVRDQFLSV